MVRGQCNGDAELVMACPTQAVAKASAYNNNLIIVIYTEVRSH